MNQRSSIRALYAALLSAAIGAAGSSPPAAQVDWSELFPDEAPAEAPAQAAPAVPAKAVVAPPTPAARAAVEPPAAPRTRAVDQRPAAKRAAAKKPEKAKAKTASTSAGSRHAGRERATTTADRRRQAPPAAPTAKRVARLVVPPPRPPAPAEKKPAAKAAQALPVAPPAVVAGPAEKRSDGLHSLAEFGLRPDSVITAENMRQYAKLLSPGLEWALVNGLRMRVVEPRRIEMPRPYREATEKYAGQVRMGPDKVRLFNYAAGQPFPHIDPNDPDAAMKIMWNYYYGFGITDDLDARLFDADTGSIGRNRGMDVERHYIIDHLRRLHYNGRLYVDPKPELPNPEGYRAKQSLHPLLEPYDLKGVGGTFYRYLDPDRQDDSWIYLPQLRRVRRLSTAQRSDALFGQDTDVDSYFGYDGHIAWMTYRLLGERPILGIMHARNVPVKWQEPEDWIFDEVWEPREVWVIEAKSKFSQYAYGKRILFIDKQGWVVTHSDIYDRAGQLWKVWINMWSAKKEAIPGARISVYEDEMLFTHAIVMIDTQLSHATKSALPSTKAIGEETIYLNMGERSGTDEEFFSIAHLIQAGR